MFQTTADTHGRLFMSSKGKKVKVFRYKPDVALGVPGG
jgi:hypothetical protein